MLDTTFILPCAGEGSRLNLGYPKELFEIYNGFKLIDFSLHHIIRTSDKKKGNIKVSVVITKQKEDVYNYVRARLPYFEVNKVFFNSEYKEWPGSVFSARGSFSECNIVLLPDSYLSISKGDQFYSDKGKSIVDLIQNKLKKYNTVFGYMNTNNTNILRNLGAMCIKKDKVILFKDKPKKNFHLYNSYWGCYGFSRDVGEDLYNFLYQSVYSNELNEHLTFPFSIGGFPIYSFFDLGTWDGIDNFLLSESNRSSSIPGKTQ